ncbi:MAG: NAD(P)/FAD-dependent oxidoreductase [Bacteroidales bacterium]|nr:NAD(P)/FAD-dependent oxidoreductase [Bacteroidales bacterium]MCF8391795.1 NAD(P)/FAD-dependent oxidoreductase [Bacteroidales bacterium]
MKVLVLGAGVSGHTAASFLKKKLGKKHQVIVVSPSQYYQWIPSNIWVGVGQMTIDQVRFKLNKVYKRWRIDFKQAKALSIHPEGDSTNENPYVNIEYTSEEKLGTSERVEYDYLVNATGPKLNFVATPGLGPEHHTVSVCSYNHASHAWEKLQESLKKMEEGIPQKFLIGTGHAMATCQGAAFEYTLNIAFEINKRKLAHLADITWITNEYELGDFGMGGAFIKRGGYITSTKVFTESVLAENNIKWIKRAGVKKIEKGKAFFERLDGSEDTAEFDFAMLIPAFAGQGISASDKNGNDITSKLFAPNGLMFVDADYTQKPYDEWSIKDWPENYRSPVYQNIWAAGIAFAPPHSISKPMISPKGTAIFPTPPRTGMPSGVIGKVIAQNIAFQIKTNTDKHKHTASMGRMGAACIVSVGYGITNGLGASMTVSPIVPDWEKYPDWGRDINATVGEIGLAGHWIKLFLHYLFMHKAKGYPFWWLLPE